MSAAWLTTACLLLGLASALVAGVLLTFSDFVMRGLALAETAAGIEAMQQINRTVLRSVFLTLFLLLAPTTLGLAIYAWAKLDGAGQGLIIAAAVIYLVSVFGVTIFANVPMNQRLDGMAPTSAQAREYWPQYLRRWTAWNHARTVGSAASCGCLIMAAVSLG